MNIFTLVGSVIWVVISCMMHYDFVYNCFIVVPWVKKFLKQKERFGVGGRFYRQSTREKSVVFICVYFYIDVCTMQIIIDLNIMYQNSYAFWTTPRPG